MNVNIAAESRVQFTLVYDELLSRRRGLYEHVINIDPGQPVRDLQVKVNIIESQPIVYLHVPEIRELHENAVHTRGKRRCEYVSNCPFSAAHKCQAGATRRFEHYLNGSTEGGSRTESISI